MYWDYEHPSAPGIRLRTYRATPEETMALPAKESDTSVAWWAELWVDGKPVSAYGWWSAYSRRPDSMFAASTALANLTPDPVMGKRDLERCKRAGAALGSRLLWPIHKAVLAEDVTVETRHDDGMERLAPGIWAEINDSLRRSRTRFERS